MVGVKGMRSYQKPALNLFVDINIADAWINDYTVIGSHRLIKFSNKKIFIINEFHQSKLYYLLCH